MRTGLVRGGQDEYLSRAEIQKIQAKGKKRKKGKSKEGSHFFFFYLIMSVIYSRVNTVACNSSVMA